MKDQLLFILEIFTQEHAPNLKQYLRSHTKKTIHDSEGEYHGHRIDEPTHGSSYHAHLYE